MKGKISIAVLAALFVWLPQTVLAEVRAVTSIKPVHGLVASILNGIAEPELLIKGVESPHDYQLRPSDAKSMQEADFIVWIGPSIETSISQAIESLAKDAILIELSEISGLTLYEFRSTHMHRDGEEEHHDEDEHERDHKAENDEGDHSHEEEHQHEAETHDDERHEEDERSAQGEEDGHGEEHESAEHADRHDHDGEYDLHVWLDVRNAKLMASHIEAVFSEALPEHAEQLHSNSHALLKKLDQLESSLESEAQMIADKPYIVFHDAYQYFERWLDLDSVAAVTLNPEILPGIGQINELKEAVHETGAICAFAEPQFNPDILHVLQEGTDLKIGMLDPLGADVEPSSNAYFEVMQNMMNSLHSCLLN